MFSSTARYSRASSTGGRRRLGASSTGSACTHRASPGPGHARTDGGPLVAADGHGRQAAGQRSLFHDLGDHADAGVAALDVGHEQQPAAGRPGGLDGGPGLVGLERHGEHHPGQHHP